MSAALGIIHLGINCSGKASLSILLQLEVTYPGLSGHYTFQQMSGLRINGTSKHAAHLHHASDTCRLHWLPVESGQKRQPNKLHSSFRRSEAIWMRSLECWSETCKQRASKKSLLVPQCSWLPPLPMRRRCGWPSVCRSDLCLSWPHSHSLWHSCMKRRSSFRHVHTV